MTTIYQMNSELTAGTAGDIAVDDVIQVYDTSAKVHKRYTVADLAAGGLTGVVNTTATTLTVTASQHAGKSITINSAAPLAITLPQATGTGNQYHFVIQTSATATAHTIKVANSTDIIQGICHFLTTSSDNVIGYLTTATDDTITLNGTTKGGIATGQWWIRDVKTGTFSVWSNDKATGTTATPFSNTV